MGGIVDYLGDPMDRKKTGWDASLPGADTAVKRRTLVQGIAWATPAIAFASAAPAMAASPGLQGWVTVGKDCDWDNFRYDVTLDIDGRGDYPDHGLWVFDGVDGQPPSNASITFYVSSGLGTLNWSTATGNSGWSAPTLNGSPPGGSISGFTAYTTTYSGTWSFNTGAARWDADGDPHFTTTIENRPTCPTVQVYAYRRVTINSVVVGFLRGPISL